MFKRYYTTQMSASKNQLKMRFVKIRSENGRYAKTFSRITAVILAICTIFATVVLASVDGYEHKNGTLTVNGKSLQVDIIHIDNIKYCNTDSYYIPLRKTFEALGYTVNYDVDKSTLPRRMTGLSEFPTYSYEGQEKLVTDSITQQIYGATVQANTNMPVIQCISSSGQEEYFQIGSEFSSGWAPPAIITEDTTYVPIRAVAMCLIPNGEDFANSVCWDDVTHDTYYQGRLTFDAENSTVNIDTSAGGGVAMQYEVLKKIRETAIVTHTFQGKKYWVIGIEKENEHKNPTFISIETTTGKTAVLGEFPPKDYKLESDSEFLVNGRKIELDKLNYTAEEEVKNVF